MDVGSTAGLASYTNTSASNQVSTQVGIATLKKALDTQAEMATQMVQSVPEVPTEALPDNVGRNINVTA
ncbi:putative motility protein [Thiorhodococcus mannitoliphagus]|uniref:Putative motility protein n=1 Tax=Thiorhodococcus mannitoliphagus TaxID=329406 RepID=A0A6P1DVZ4_9GAMM|nr:YjfB family protein [Thiorhodococcus mannitoliphagus]NEX21181.1 putative motility protein [Thiorhodococcus mannitoliphagus]